MSDNVAFIHAYKSFGDKIIMSDFNWVVPCDKVVTIMAPSGSGKTTLLRIVAGLTELDSGTVRNRPASVSYMFQENRLLPWFDIQKNLSLVTGEPGIWLTRAGLVGELHAMPRELSGGMLRRVALVRALAHSAPLLILDEPFKEMDERTKNDMMALVLEQDRRMIVVTHDRSEANAMGGVVVEFVKF